MSNRIIRFTSLAVLAAVALSAPPKAAAQEACAGQTICWLGCPGNLTLFCGCTSTYRQSVCQPGGCGWFAELPDLVICGDG